MKRMLTVLAMVLPLVLFTGCATQGGVQAGTAEEPAQTGGAAQTEEIHTPQERYRRQMKDVFGAQTAAVYDADKAALTVTVTEGYEDAAAFLQKCVRACSAALAQEDADMALEKVTVLFGGNTLMAGKSKTSPPAIWYTKAFSREDAQYDALEQAYYANAALAGQDIGV